MASVHLDERATTLLDPVRDALDRGLARLPAGPVVKVSVGPSDGFYRAEATSVVLSEGLDGDGVHHALEADGPLPPLDRWRRAASSVLEGVVLAALAYRTRLTPTDDWWWSAVAIHQADLAAPDLGLADPDLALALQTGDPGAHPRAGVAVARAWVATGSDPAERVRYLLDGGILSADEWLAIGQWIFGESGPRADLPVPVDLVAQVDIPVQLPAWSWRRVEVPAHPRGGRVQVVGEGAVEPAWAHGGEVLRAIAGAAQGGCELVAESGGPLGSWEVASAEGFGQVMGARGVTYQFRADGSLELIMADAFVGPLAALAMADEVGTSGTCRGRWWVVGDRRLRFGDVDTSGLTMHGRRERFMVPAQGFGMGEWLEALSDDVWQWRLTKDGRLMLRGRMMGGQVEVRLRPPDGVAEE